MWRGPASCRGCLRRSCSPGRRTRTSAASLAAAAADDVVEAETEAGVQGAGGGAGDA